MIQLIIQVATVIFGSLAALMSITLFVRLRWPSPVLWILKLYTSALSTLLGSVGLLSITVGVTTGSMFITVIGIYDVLIFFTHILRILNPTDFANNLRRALDLQPNDPMPKQISHFRLFFNAIKSVPNPRLEQNIVFSRLPGTDRELLCDVWQPHEGVARSGAAFIYLHGGAWYLLDKDLGTRPFFTKLAAHGHVIMDVAYRLPPETDMMGMVTDVKRAIVWMKKNARTYGVNPNRIVVGGGSSGAHLALLAAYTANNPMFTPGELEREDVSVCGAISLYGPSNLVAMYYHTNQHLTTRSTSDRPKKAAPTQMPQWIIKKMGKNYHRLGFDKGLENGGDLASLLGGHPDECPKTYELFSPVSHVHVGCPPTLLIHGEHDSIAPVNSTCFLYSRLTKKRVPTALHIFPQTDHAFDLILPNISPSASGAFFDVERFIAMLVLKKKPKNQTTTSDVSWST